MSDSSAANSGNSWKTRICAKCKEAFATWENDTVCPDCWNANDAKIARLDEWAKVAMAALAPQEMAAALTAAWSYDIARAMEAAREAMIAEMEGEK